MIRQVLTVISLFLFAGTANAGTLSGQARDLDGTPVQNVTVIVVNANNEVITQQFFRNGRFVINIPDGRLFANNRSISVLFSAPGRDDARLDNIFGTQVGQQVDVVLPVKYQAIEPRTPAVCPPPVVRCKPCRWRRCR
jgi:hypothetical protein